jgi:hypothetical protein
MALPFPSPFEILRVVLPPLAAIVVVLVLVKLGPPLVRRLRQRAYDRTSAGEMQRLEIAIGRGRAGTPDAAIALVRGLHPGRRLSAGGWWRVGWPSIELRAVWRDGRLAWQIDADAEMRRLVEGSLASLYPGIELRVVARTERPAVWSAVARLRNPSSRPLGDPGQPGPEVLSRLAVALSSAPAGAEVRLRTFVRPIDPRSWERQLYPESASPSIVRLVAGEIVSTLTNQHGTATSSAPVTLSAVEREALAHKRAGRLGYETGLVIEVAGLADGPARALLREAVECTTPLGAGRQAIVWTFRRGAVSSPPRFALGDWELAQLWYLPDTSFEAARFPRERPLAPAAPVVRSGPTLLVGESRDGPLALPVASLARHMAIVGSTGSGKSTLLLNLALAVLDSPIGATVIDPHGDLAGDILARIPANQASSVHVLRLADRSHPRGFNFLERTDPDQAQLVASEFVGLFTDLWPDYTGPKMQHYLRHALLTMLSHPEPQTILELVRILTDDAFRAGYLEHVDDAMLRAFWRNEWPAPGVRDHDTSIKAVLNKLGAFVSYHSIRDVVGQGTSTIRPRALMDAGDLLVVDLSRVGPDNARLFGAMLISRYYIDAVGRQGTGRETRRQHLLIVDEVATFDTRALVKIHDEGRKFGLVLVTVAQSLKGLGERLRDSVLTNAGVIAAMAPGVEDAQSLRRLFDPLTAEDLVSLPPHALLLRAPSPDGPRVYQGRVRLPAPGDPDVAAAVVAASDRRDARPFDAVRAEIRRREGGEPATDVRPPRSNGKRRDHA